MCLNSKKENFDSNFGPYKRHQRLNVNIFDYLIIVVNDKDTYKV